MSFVAKLYAFIKSIRPLWVGQLIAPHDRYQVTLSNYVIHLLIQLGQHPGKTDDLRASTYNSNNFEFFHGNPFSHE